MSYVASGTLGVVAAVMALGAVHLEVAAGSDGLGPAQRGDASVFMPLETSKKAAIARPAAIQPVAVQRLVEVDRSAKGDRPVTSLQSGGLTLSFRVPSIPEMSVLMRVPAGATADALRKAPAPTTGKALPKGSPDRSSSSGRRPVACEPVVSILTDVARQLEAGRCVT